VPKFDRHWIATVLTAQVAAGLGDRGPDVPRLGHHRPRDAVLRRGVARHGARGRRLQLAGAGGAALRGQLVVGPHRVDCRLSETVQALDFDQFCTGENDQDDEGGSVTDL